MKAQLTPRELEVMRIASEDVSPTRKISNAAIAARLNISINTVKRHKQAILALSNTERALTRREHDVWRLMAEGYDPKEISSLMSISYRTVGIHKNNLYRKLMVHNMAQATKMYHNRGKAKGASA